MQNLGTSLLAAPIADFAQGAGDTAFALNVGNLGKVACARGSNQCALTVCPRPPNVNLIPLHRLRCHLPRPKPSAGFQRDWPVFRRDFASG